MCHTQQEPVENTPDSTAVSLDSADICYLEKGSGYLVDTGMDSTWEGSASAVFIPILLLLLTRDTVDCQHLTKGAEASLIPGGPIAGT